MKRIGLLGGMSWESSIEYERMINEAVRGRLGGVSSADLIVRSYDFAEIERLQMADAWDEAGKRLANDAVRLEDFGAEVIALCTNTMHRVAPAIEAAISVPFVHIADSTATAATHLGVATVGVLGTRYTMEQPFYRERIERHGLSVAIPGDRDRGLVHDIIFGELVRGTILESSRSVLLGVIDRLIEAGAGGVISGCTEIELLVKPDDVPVPFFPSTALHAEAITRAALD